MRGHGLLSYLHKLHLLLSEGDISGKSEERGKGEADIASGF